jgi:hypothetical protein
VLLVTRLVPERAKLILWSGSLDGALPSESQEGR